MSGTCRHLQDACLSKYDLRDLASTFGIDQLMSKRSEYDVFMFTLVLIKTGLHLIINLNKVNIKKSISGLLGISWSGQYVDKLQGWNGTVKLG